MPHSKTDSRVRVLVVGDHATVPQGLGTTIESDSLMTVGGEASDGLQVIEATETHQPHAPPPREHKESLLRDNIAAR
jgi:chemotaxis response regulator CheB